MRKSPPPEPTEEPQLSCCECWKEIPRSAALTPEGMDYVAHFCCAECVEQFKRRGTPPATRAGD